MRSVLFWRFKMKKIEINRYYSSVWAFPFDNFVRQLASPYEVFLRMFFSPLMVFLTLYVQYDCFIWMGFAGAILLIFSIPLVVWCFCSIFMTNSVRKSVSASFDWMNIYELITSAPDVVAFFVRGAWWFIVNMFELLFAIIHHLFEVF